MENSSGSHSGGNSIDRTTAFVGFAILAAFLIAFAAFFAVQLNTMNSRISTSGLAELADRIGILERRVTIIENSITPPPVKLKLLYDSSDNFTSEVVNAVAAASASLKEQNLAIELVDRRGKLAETRKDGFNAIPALFISETEAARDKRLLETVLNLPAASVDNESGYRIEALGFIFHRKTMLDTACKLPDNKVSLHVFNNLACPSCAGLHEDLVTSVAQLAPKVEYNFRHLPLATFPNSQKAAEASECARDAGKFDEYVELAFKNVANLSDAKLKELARTAGVADAKAFDACLDAGAKESRVRADSTEATLTYSLSTVPVFLVDCKHAYIALTGNQLRDGLCRARPDACGFSNSTGATNSSGGNSTNPS